MEGFLCYRFGGFIFRGAYTWRGLFSEFYGILWQEQNYNTGQWFPCETMSEERMHKIPTDDTSLPRSGLCFWLVEANFSHSITRRSTTQIWVVHLIGPATREICFSQSEALPRSGSSVWNFFSGSSDLFSLGNQWWWCKISVSFSLAMLLAIYENEWRKFQGKNLAPLSKKIIAIGTMAPCT